MTWASLHSKQLTHNKVKAWRTTPSPHLGCAYLQLCLVMIYRVYNTIFLQLHGCAPVAFVLLLPIMKCFMNLGFMPVHSLGEDFRRSVHD